MDKKATPQEYWDMLILDCWTNGSMAFPAFVTFKDYIGFDDSMREGDGWGEMRDNLFEGIDRQIIQHYKQLYKPMRSLVKDHLPQLSTYLWHIWPMTTEEQYHKAMEILTSSKAKGINKNHPKSELRKGREDLNRTRFVDINAGHRRSDWEKVK